MCEENLLEIWSEFITQTFKEEQGWNDASVSRLGKVIKDFDKILIENFNSTWHDNEYMCKYTRKYLLRRYVLAVTLSK